jgi:carbon storage regulator
MLVLCRKQGQRIVLGDNIWVTVVEIRGGRVRLGVRAPAEVSIRRLELVRAAAGSRPSSKARPARP